MKRNLSIYLIIGIGCLIGVWASAALIGGIIAAGGVTALAGQYMVATGMITPLHTLVDYYTHIKGIEYLICVAFFVIFPVFYTYVNTEKKSVEIKI